MGARRSAVRLGGRLTHTFVTERLSLRSLVEDDRLWLEDLYRGAGEADDDIESELPDALAHYARHGFCHFAAFARADGEPVGVIELHFAGDGLVGIDADEVELGWVIASERRGEGFATEGADAVATFAIEELGHDHVVAYIRPENPASVRVAEKIGMTIRGPGRSKNGDRVTVWELRRPAGS